MDMEGSRWVEATLEDTATSPAWEATMTTVRFNFVHFFLMYIFKFFSLFWFSHIYSCTSTDSQGGMNNSYYGGSRGSVGMNGMGGGWGM